MAVATLQDLVVLSYGSSDDWAAPAIELAGVELLVSAQRNVLVARTGDRHRRPGRQIGLYGAGLRIEDNVVLGFDRGIDLGGALALPLRLPRLRQRGARPEPGRDPRHRRASRPAARST